MRKTAILIAAIAFDLGVVVVAGHADPLQPSKDAKAGGPAASLLHCANGTHFGKTCKADAQSLRFYKFDTVNTLQACMTHGGTVVKNSAGEQACQSEQAIPGAETMHWPNKAGN